MIDVVKILSEPSTWILKFLNYFSQDNTKIICVITLILNFSQLFLLDQIAMFSSIKAAIFSYLLVLVLALPPCIIIFSKFRMDHLIYHEFTVLAIMGVSLVCPALNVIIKYLSTVIFGIAIFFDSQIATAASEPLYTLSLLHLLGQGFLTFAFFMYHCCCCFTNEPEEKKNEKEWIILNQLQPIIVREVRNPKGLDITLKEVEEIIEGNLRIRAAPGVATLD